MVMNMAVDKSLIMGFILLNAFGNYIEANIALTMLEEEGIKCYIEDENSGIIIHMASGIRLMVYEEQAERAAEVIKKAETEYLKSVSCPVCHHTGFEIKMVKESHEAALKKLPFGRLMAFMSKAFSKDGTTTDVKHYVCLNCNKDFEELPL